MSVQCNRYNPIRNVVDCSPRERYKSAFNIPWQILIVSPLTVSMVEWGETRSWKGVYSEIRTLTIP